MWNNATQISSTILYVDHLTRDNVDIDVFLALIKTGDSIVIQDENNSNNYQKWTVSGTPTQTLVYTSIPVTYVNGGYSFSNGQDIIFIPLSIGVQGPQGPQGFQGPTGSNGTNGSQGNQGFQGPTGTSANVVLLAGDVGTTASVVSDITGFSFPVNANKTYTIFGWYRTTCSGAGGVKRAINGPTASLISYHETGPVTNATYGVNQMTTYNTLSTTGLAQSQTTTAVRIDFYAVVTTTSAGTIQFRHASGTNGQTSTAKAGSFFQWVEN